jgi:branched-chain amino acid transport system permease protein
MPDTVIFFLIQVLNGVQEGLLLFLVTGGLTLIFGIMRIINLAHGSFYMLGAYLAFALAQSLGSFFLAVLIALPIAALLGLLLEAVLFRFLYGRDHLYQVLMTYGLILVLEETRSLLFGDDVHGVAVPAILDRALPLTDTLGSIC